MKTETARRKHRDCSSETSVRILTADFNTSFRRVYAVKAFAFFVAVYFTAAMSDSPYNTGDANPFIFGNVKSNIGGGYDHTTGSCLLYY